MMRNNTVDQLTGTEYQFPTEWKYLTTGASPGSGALIYDTSDNTTHIESDAVPIGLDIQTPAASIRDLRFALMLTEYLEKLMRLGDRYRDFIKGMWKVDPFPMLVDRPLYLGGKSGLVTVSEVMSHTETDMSSQGPAAVIGSYRGQMLHMNSTGKVRYHCAEHGFILGLVSVYPKSMYMQGLHRAWKRTTKYDYPLDQFNFIGDDALLNREVMLSYLTADEDWNDEIFGYVPRYSDWRYRNATVSGQMRDSQGYLFSFTMARFFDVNESDELLLNSEFLECKPAKERIFQLTDEWEEEVYAYIWNEAHVQRQLSKFGIPGL